MTVDRQERNALRSGPEVIKLEFILKLKIKCKDWLLVDTCLQAANHCALFRHMSASSQSLHFILSLRLLKFYNLRARCEIYYASLGGSEKYTLPILLICIVDKSLCEACPVSFRVFIFVI